MPTTGVDSTATISLQIEPTIAQTADAGYSATNAVNKTQPTDDHQAATVGHQPT